MSNYLQAQIFTVEKFSLAVHPYLAVPDNVFEEGCALQYGADFKTTFKRAAPQHHDIGLIQLIFPQTKLFSTTRVGSWNLDKHDTDGISKIKDCLYGEDDTVIGTHSEHYQGQGKRSISPTECSLIDTPREINAAFSQGVFSGNTTTKFANYVLDMEDLRIFDQGLLWGYSMVQDAEALNMFHCQIITPKSCLLSKTNEHLDAIAGVLKLTREDIEELIA